MVKLNHESGPFGDETSNYNVETDANNVSEFIKEVVKENPYEWGEFCIRADNNEDRDVCVCAYEKGEIIRKALNYDAYGNANVKSILANGGWGKMSYDIDIEDFASLPKQDKNEFQLIYFGKILR